MKRMMFLLALCALVACSDDSSGPSGGSPGPYKTVNAFPNLTFSRPTDIQNSGDGTSRLFVTQQTGEILWFGNDPATSIVFGFLDITDRVLYDPQSEMGLLGLAFHPHYASNGYFFVSYTTGSDTARRGRISRFSRSGSECCADPTSEKVLLEWDDAFPNHNGGQLAFGPDGYLYIAIGDEGGAGDNNNNAQDRSRIFGKILRIDVNQNMDTAPYHGIPADNPYVGNSSGWREDIWAYGLRNPWRMSFDTMSGKLIAADVGQSTWEEVDIIEKGGNYGWDCREGLVPYDQRDNPSSPLCPTAGPFIDPIHVYGHDVGQSITGGYVYHGPTQGSLRGLYIYGDFDSGRIWSLNLASHANTLLVESGMFLTTFGVGENKELYVAAYFADGTPTGIYRLEKGSNP